MAFPDGLLYLITRHTFRKKITAADNIIQLCIKLLDKLYPPYWHFYSQLPGRLMAEHAYVVVTQGGAGSSYQALSSGTSICCWPAHINHALLASRIEHLSACLFLEPNS